MRGWFFIPNLTPIVIVLLGSGCGGVTPGQGRVLDIETNLPIPGVEVHFDCGVGEIYEDFRTLRIVSTFTDEQGVFRFTRYDVRGCQFGVIMQAHKDGYEIISGGGLVFSGSSINNDHNFYLAPRTEATMWKLILLREQATGHYESIFYAFIESKLMAKTTREYQYVIDNYCSRLIYLFTLLSPEEKEILGYTRQPHPHPRYTNSSLTEIKDIRIDHDKEVLTFCSDPIQP